MGCLAVYATVFAVKLICFSLATYPLRHAVACVHPFGPALQPGEIY